MPKLSGPVLGTEYIVTYHSLCRKRQSDLQNRFWSLTDLGLETTSKFLCGFDRIVHFSEPQFLNLQNGDNKTS